MSTEESRNPRRWTELPCGQAHLQDRRRTRRAVQAASKLAENPPGSLPAQMHPWKEPTALYRLLDESDGTCAAVLPPHLHQTRAHATASGVVLLVQKTTDRALSQRHKTSGSGDIGNELGRGFFVQTVLAVRPQTGEVRGCLAQEPVGRIPPPAGHTAPNGASEQSAKRMSGCARCRPVAQRSREAGGSLSEIGARRWSRTSRRAT